LNNLLRIRSNRFGDLQSISGVQYLALCMFNATEPDALLTLISRTFFNIISLVLVLENWWSRNIGDQTKKIRIARSRKTHQLDEPAAWICNRSETRTYRDTESLIADLPSAVRAIFADALSRVGNIEEKPKGRLKPPSCGNGVFGVNESNMRRSRRLIKIYRSVRSISRNAMNVAWRKPPRLSYFRDVACKLCMRKWKNLKISRVRSRVRNARG